MFHSHCGEDVELTNRRKTAEHIGGGRHGVVLSKEALIYDQPFDIRVEETAGGFEASMALGVTQTDPNTRPQLPECVTDMERAWVLDGAFLFRDGETVGPESWPLQVFPGDKVSLVWDGDDVYMTYRGYNNCVFKDVPGPLWVVTDLNGGVYKLSIISPGYKDVATKKAAPVKKKSTVSSAARTEPPIPTRGWDMTGAMDKMALGGIGTQTMGACRGLKPKRTSGITCPFWQVFNRFIGSLQLPDIYFDPEYDSCYCTDCVLSSGDNLYYTRGEPPKTYGLPLGWCRFGLCVPMKAHGLEAFTKWHVAYHGTIPKNIRTIIESDLLMPGDYTLEGVQLAPPSGHFTENRKPEGFDIKQVFVSPTITYAGHPAYAKPESWMDTKSRKSHDIQVALQLRIKPDAYQVGKETLGLGSKQIDAKFKNSELEWSTKVRGATIIQGILVKTLIS